MAWFDCGVYLIRNTANGKVYVGSSYRIPKRWKEHCRDLKYNRHSNTRLQNSWNKHGESAFELEVVCYCNKSELLNQEQLALWAFDAVNTGYNIALKADQPPANKGVPKTKEHNLKVSKSHLGKKLSVPHKEALKAGWVNRRHRGLGQHSEAFKTATGNRFRGKKQSEEWKRKKDEANRLAAKQQNPEWRRWLGRKGAAIQNSRPFDEPEPARRIKEN